MTANKMRPWFLPLSLPPPFPPTPSWADDRGGRGAIRRNRRVQGGGERGWQMMFLLFTLPLIRML